MREAAWDVARLSPALGATVSGADLAAADPAMAARIEALLLEHQVLFFPRQRLSVDQHVALGRLFGPLEGHPHLKNPFTQHPELFELAATGGGIADEWHADLTFRSDPSVLSVLKMVRCPPCGGDTMWASTEAAYAALSPPLQELCRGLTALHDALPHNHPERMAIHPVVRVHPRTQRPSLYVNEHFTRRIVEVSAVESAMLLGFLVQWVQNPRFTVRYRWSEDTIAIWDNRNTQHFVLNDFGGERIIQRVTVMGDAPVAAAAPRWRPWARSGHGSAISRHDRQLNGFLKAQRAQGAATSAGDGSTT
jgi:taurine dioxygenase